MSSTRLIDKLPPVSPRPVQMQVLVLGMSRTGGHAVMVDSSPVTAAQEHFVRIGVGQETPAG